MIRVLIVDDSATVRRVLSAGLGREQDIEIAGTAPDPYLARDMIVALSPDVVTLDIEMPRMDGLSFLRRLMHYHPLPVIVVSSLGRETSAIALEALALGAVDFVGKPGGAFSAGEMLESLAQKIRAAATVNRRLLKPKPGLRVSQQSSLLKTTDAILAIGASTGGVQAIEGVLSAFPADAPGTVIVQHMPPGFTAGFAKRLNSRCAPVVREAVDGETIHPGKALIAPGDRHLTVVRSGARYLVRLTDGPPVQYQRPSVDVLFESVAKAAGANAAGVILTGMGADGARGLLAMRQAGAMTIAQDETSSVVYGMPKAAADMEAACKTLPLDQIAGQAIRACLERS